MLNPHNNIYIYSLPYEGEFECQCVFSLLSSYITRKAASGICSLWLAFPRNPNISQPSFTSWLCEDAICYCLYFTINHIRTLIFRPKKIRWFMFILLKLAIWIGCKSFLPKPIAFLSQPRSPSQVPNLRRLHGRWQLTLISHQDQALRSCRREVLKTALEIKDGPLQTADETLESGCFLWIFRPQIVFFWRFPWEKMNRSNFPLRSSLSCILFQPMQG